MSHNLEHFFNPKTVAVIGASSNVKKVGHAILKNFLDEFKGKIYPVNWKEGEILGWRCHKSILDIKEPIDLAVIAVPPEASNKVVRECVKKKVSAVVLVTAGYREIGTAEGKEREKELEEIIKKSNTRIIGPNCLGILDTKTKVNTMFLPEYKMDKISEGKISFISQSGAFGSAALDWLAHEGVGISKFISYGNKADVDEADLLEYLLHDSNTSTIVMYIEGVSNGKRLMAMLKKVTRKKPVIVLKAGKSEAGIKAASSHTGSLAGSYEIFQAMLKQTGCVEADTLEDVFDFSKAFADQPLPKGKRIGVITNGGGFGVISADACVEFELELATLSDNTIKSMKGAMPAYSTIHNPLDLIGDADSSRYKKALDSMISDKNIDGIVCIPLMQTSALGPEVIEIISGISEMKKKPILVCTTGGQYTENLMVKLEEKGVPVYPTPHRAMKAMKALFDHIKLEKF